MPAVWKIAWPTVLQNAIGGLQGIIDHAMVGHFVGFTANAAIGVSWQIFLVVIVFISSLFTGMGVLVARAAGANDHERVDRVVYQAFLVAVLLSVGVLAPSGYFLAPRLLSLVNASPAVVAQALPFLRTMFLFSIGMLLFFMLGGALRAAGDARTPLRLGVVMTALNIGFNVVLISGAGPIPALGTRGAALGTVLASLCVSGAAMWMMLTGRLVIHFRRDMSWWPDLKIIRQLFRFGLPAGVQGVAMNIAGVLLLRFIGSLEHSAEAQAAYAVAYTELFSLITWTSVGLMGAAAAVAGQNLGAGNPDRAARAVHIAARLGLAVAATMAVLFVTIPRALFAIFSIHDPVVVQLGTAAAAVPQCFGILHHGGADVHRRAAGHRRYAQSALHHPRVAGRRADGPVLRPAGVGQADACGRMDGDRPRPRDPVRPVDLAVPAGSLENHPRGVKLIR